MPIPAKPKKKPVWPHWSTTTLTAAPNGSWMKKWKGRPYYFGPWRDPDGALARWQAEWPGITKGSRVSERVSSLPPDRATVLEVCTGYLADAEAKVEQGKLSRDTFRDDRLSARYFVEAVGPENPAVSLQPDHFNKALAFVSKRRKWGFHRRNQFVIDVRGFFNWALRNRRISRLPDYGTLFTQAELKATREYAETKKGRDIAAEDLVVLLASAPLPLRTMMMLGLNGGYGPTDCVALTVADVDLRAGVIRRRRIKTQAPRLVLLWPETRAMLAAVIGGRKDGHVFVTGTGAPWRKEYVTRKFGKIAKARGWSCTFYDLRRTLGTIAKRFGDDDALRLVIGHVNNSVLEDYNQQETRGRVMRLLEHVRLWLWVLGHMDHDDDETAAWVPLTAAAPKIPSA